MPFTTPPPQRRLRKLRLVLAARIWLALGGVLACSAQAAPPNSPQDLFGPLFEAVQTERVFPDGKTFVDAVP
ncbi:MAG: hypothetical protein P8Y58_02835, partial [Novosphingobium sp.]